MTRRIQFLNVDLDLRSDAELQELLDALKLSDLVINNLAKGFASVGLKNSQPQSVDEAVLVYSDAIRALLARPLSIWKQCGSRSFDVGIQSGREPHEKHFCLPEKTVALMAGMSAELTITIYGDSTVGSLVG